MNTEVSIEHTTIYDEYQMLEDRHTALMEAFQEVRTVILNENNEPYFCLLRILAITENALAAAQEQDA
jgi:hypothetical protein